MPHSSLLLVDDDLGTRETFGAALAMAGLSVETADSGANALVVMKAHGFDLLLVDFRMPDMAGTDLIQRLQQGGHAVPFVLMSAFATVALAVEAMKLGALDVLEKPLAIDELLDRVLPLARYSRREQDHDTADAGVRGMAGQSKSASERWATHVVRACQSGGDLRTIDEWARFLGVSYSSLSESCRLLDIHPHDARDFARLLRAVIRVAEGGGRVEPLLDVHDGRTLRKLLGRAGLGTGVNRSRVSVAEFLDRQHFIPCDNDGLKAVRCALKARTFLK